VRHRDPAVELWSTPLLYLKGFHAIQSYRITHYLWNQNRKALALYLQNQISVAFDVDIHPAAKIGHGIMFDHATGIVVGETSVIENDVSILQGVTLGGTGKESGDRHPKVREGVMIGAGAKILNMPKSAPILLYFNLCRNMPPQQVCLLVLSAKTKRQNQPLK